MGRALGLSDDTAQKRVSRAIEQLRQIFAQRDITLGPLGLTVAISVNAVQAAPAGLTLTISTAAAALGGATVGTASIATVTTAKTIAMTTLQKAIVTTAFVATIGAGFYELRQATTARAELRTFQQQHSPLNEQLEQLTREHDQATRQIAALQRDNERLNRATAELLKLRGDVAQLRQQNKTLAQAAAGNATNAGSAAGVPGFGRLGNYLSMENLTDAGNATGETLLETFFWAVQRGDVKRLEELGAPLGGQSQPGDQNPLDLIK